MLCGYLIAETGEIPSTRTAPRVLMMAGQKGGKHMNKLEEMRRKAGLTQSDLSQKSGVATSTISRLEVVGLNDAKVKTLLDLADAIGCEIGDFF